MYIPSSHTSLLLTLTTTLLLFMQSTTSLPATNSLPSHPIYSLPPPTAPPPLNASGISNGNCASRSKYPSWTSPDWVIEDCYMVVQQLYVSQVHAHPKVVYEFLAQGLSPRQYPLAQRTPRKYIFRSCVLTIMMLDWFQPGQLPAGTGYNRADTDLSTYQDIYDAARSIETACTVSKSPGWMMTGKNSAMGVFVWSTNSHINEITGGFPVQSLGLNDSDIIVLDDVLAS